MFAAPVPSHAERHVSVLLLLERGDFARAPCGFFAIEVHLELSYQVERTSLVPCAAGPICLNSKLPD